LIVTGRPSVAAVAASAVLTRGAILVWIPDVDDSVDSVLADDDDVDWKRRVVENRLELLVVVLVPVTVLEELTASGDNRPTRGRRTAAPPPPREKDDDDARKAATCPPRRMLPNDITIMSTANVVNEGRPNM
jgi:hypothetical protein